jgi:hypothetical protein
MCSCQHEAVTREVLARFVGGANVPAWLGRVNGTWPFAVLEIGSTGLSLRMRRIARVFGPVESLEATPATLRRVYPVRGVPSAGVGFTAQNGHDFYFWTPSGRRILDLLGRLGYPVSLESSAATKIWTMRR